MTLWQCSSPAPSAPPPHPVLTGRCRCEAVLSRISMLTSQEGAVHLVFSIELLRCPKKPRCCTGATGHSMSKISFPQPPLKETAMLLLRLKNESRGAALLFLHHTAQTQLENPTTETSDVVFVMVKSCREPLRREVDICDQYEVVQ